MALLTPPDPERVGPPHGDRRWLVVPVLAVSFVLVAVVKPWGDERSAEAPAAPASVVAVAGSPSPTSAPTIAPTPAIFVTGGIPAAADPVYAHQVDPVPWANELVADTGGAWAWSDTGIVSRIGTDDIVTRTDLGRPRQTPGPLGARGIALAGTGVWASDPVHYGLARIDVGPGTVAARIPLWTAADAAAVDAAAGSTHDRWASAWGFAIDGESILIPSIAARPGDVADPAAGDGQLWRIDTTGSRTPGWISIDRPTGVAVGFGSAWVVSCCGDHSDARTYTIMRLDEETGDIQASISLPAHETMVDARPVIRIGPDSVWVGLADQPLIVRIDPATSSIRSTLQVDLPVTDLAIGQDGSVWATGSEPWYRFGAVVGDRCDGQLARIQPETERVVAATTMACPMSVAVAGDDVWVGTAGTEGTGTSGGVPPMLVHLRAVAAGSK
jgi:hypothetical protein